jgi:hypothetical protein
VDKRGEVGEYSGAGGEVGGGKEEGGVDSTINISSIMYFHNANDHILSLPQ